MNIPTVETQQCLHCGLENEEGRALCANCQSPLTAYAGQLRGQEEMFDSRLAVQVAQLDSRPKTVMAAVAFHVLIALFWPLASLLASFQAKPTLNADGTNYVGAAVGSIGPLLNALVMVPIAGVLLVVAWGAGTQQPWGWKATAAILVSFGLLMFWRLLHAPLLALFWLAITGVLAYRWFQSDVKAWYALD